MIVLNGAGSIPVYLIQVFLKKTIVLFWPILAILDYLSLKISLNFSTSISVLSHLGHYTSSICLFSRDIILFSINPVFLDDGLSPLKLTTYGWTLQKLWVTLTFSHLDLYYKQFLCHNHNHYLTQLQSSGTLGAIIGLRFLGTVLKSSLLLFISLLILQLNSLSSYIMHLKGLNYYLRFFLLHESEKEVGQVDDIFQFIIFNCRGRSN